MSALHELRRERPAVRLLAPLALLMTAACDGAAAEGPFALAYDGQEDCVEADVSGMTPPDAWTVELWIRGDGVNPERPRPMLEWKGVFALGAAAGGDTTFSVGEADGLSWGTSIMDGVLHHVAGTFDGTKATLYVDGTKQAFADGTTGADTASLLRVGCNAALNVYAGLLDEVRLSSTVRYDGDFDRPVEPFAKDDDTVLLFHFDEGTGDESVDAAAGKVAALYGPEWVPFDVAEGQ